MKVKIHKVLQKVYLGYQDLFLCRILSPIHMHYRLPFYLFHCFQFYLLTLYSAIRFPTKQIRVIFLTRLSHALAGNDV